jgi:transcriptional regulator with XRE-family HTH domain
MITGAQIRMARGYLRWSAKQLGDRAGVAESTVKRMEQDEGFPVARGANIEAVYRTLAEAGIVFLSENDGSVGIRVRARAAKPPAPSKPPSRKQAKPAKPLARGRPMKSAR